ncbi:MAG: hypothetical protein AMXMBFR59_06420 [Rhodanobacteraceae bacterium]
MNKKLIVCMVVVTSVAACARATGGDQAPSPSSDYALSAAEISLLSERGKGGDGEAIKKLVAYFLVHEQNHDVGMRWLERLGDLGDSDAQESVIGYYENRKSLPGGKAYAKELRERWQRK